MTRRKGVGVVLGHFGGEVERESITAEDLRCLCGSLVAKVKSTGIELKCRRCKRVALIPLLKKEQKMLEEKHPEVFRYQITFNHPHGMEETTSNAAPVIESRHDEGPYFGSVS